MIIDISVLGAAIFHAAIQGLAWSLFPSPLPYSYGESLNSPISSSNGNQERWADGVGIALARELPLHTF